MVGRQAGEQAVSLSLSLSSFLIISIRDIGKSQKIPISFFYGKFLSGKQPQLGWAFEIST